MKKKIKFKCDIMDRHQVVEEKNKSNSKTKFPMILQIVLIKS
jgi:hypothetical protein